MRPGDARLVREGFGALGAIWALSLPLLSAGSAAAAGEGTAVREASGQASYTLSSEIDSSTWVDHDAVPIPQPPDWEPSFWGHQFRDGIIEPLSHAFDIPDLLLAGAGLFGAETDRAAVNVNAFDEVPNSTWFTNRNHVRAVPVSELRRGAHPPSLPAKPWTIKHAKEGGRTAGFQIKDAEGKRWLIKLDPKGHAQLTSGADRVSCALLHAAGYNLPHNEAVRFVRADLAIDEDLLRGAEGEKLTEEGLDKLLARGALFPDGSYSAIASEFIAGHVLGAPSTRRRRPGDLNDWYAHWNRRELRGLYVLSSWLNSWDTKDHNFLDTFMDTGDSLGHVDHYVLDVGASLGAAGGGPKSPPSGYETFVDFGWIARRVVTLGFLVEPWRRARQDSGIPAVGNFESEVYQPDKFKTYIEHKAFREMDDRDGYWAAKIVASFSDAQVEAAVEAAQYEDPRASEYIVRNLIARRDKVARHWFGLIAPLDFFAVRSGVLSFHDLAVDVGLEAGRSYEAVVESEGGPASKARRVALDKTELQLENVGTGATRLTVELSITGSHAKPARVELTRKDGEWVVARVRHG